MRHAEVQDGRFADVPERLTASFREENFTTCFTDVLKRIVTKPRIAPGLFALG
ncbi:hypothetical protein [Afipia clevelandensis]|uniref:Uncharacterized protein n=1 Tax=Afipia clevelandensis ATCC 49720 TaxID=883079 RepID=K8NZ97_9BRAD|nr:hypothetical protein [Afipia clevelandensis]EKS35657.1 hypothetical protein HMPREF9696_01869 [Afipia clevelandensis ATCC 49720]